MSLTYNDMQLTRMYVVNHVEKGCVHKLHLIIIIIIMVIFKCYFSGELIALS